MSPRHGRGRRSRTRSSLARAGAAAEEDEEAGEEAAPEVTAMPSTCLWAPTVDPEKARDRALLHRRQWQAPWRSWASSGWVIVFTDKCAFVSTLCMGCTKPCAPPSVDVALIAWCRRPASGNFEIDLVQALCCKFCFKPFRCNTVVVVHGALPWPAADPVRPGASRLLQTSCGSAPAPLAVDPIRVAQLPRAGSGRLGTGNASCGCGSPEKVVHL